MEVANYRHGETEEQSVRWADPSVGPRAMLTASFVEAGKALDEIASRLAEKGARCRMAVAFLRNEGMDRLDHALRRANCKIVAGASSFHITD